MGNLKTKRKTLSPKNTLIEVARFTVLGLLAVFSAVPLLVTVWNSLKTQVEIANNPLGLPSDPKWQNYLDAWTVGNFGTGFASSVAVVVGSIADRDCFNHGRLCALKVGFSKIRNFDSVSIGAELTANPTISRSAVFRLVQTWSL